MGRPRGSSKRQHRLRLEPLEDRRLLSFDPTAYEQASLEHINRMRMDPQHELEVLFSSVDPVLVARDPVVQFTIDLFNVSAGHLVSQYSTLEPLPPLAWNAQLHDAALAHNRAMIAADKQSHQLPNEPSLGQRMIGAGYKPTYGGENVYAYAQSVLFGHAGFAVDWKPGAPGIQNPPTHRNNIMSPVFQEVGIDVAEEYNNATAVGPLVITQNFGSRSDYSPQLVGVVWDDLFDNGIYDPGEGVSSVTIRAAGPRSVFVTETMSAGGYQMALPPGTYQVTATGDSLPGTLIARNVVIGQENVKVDFELHAASSPAPVANDDTATVDERGHQLIGVLHNDTATAGSFVPSSVRIVDAPYIGTAELNVVTGWIQYRSRPGHVGKDSFTYQARSSDGVWSNPATVRIQITHRAGDFTRDERVNAADIDALFAEVAKSVPSLRFDLTSDGRVTQLDVDTLVQSVLQTRMGDANLDGLVNFADFNIWSVHRFSTLRPSWSRGDFNGDGLNDGADFNIWLSHLSSSARQAPSAPGADEPADEASDRPPASPVESPSRSMRLADAVRRRRQGLPQWLPPPGADEDILP